jgi:hypothetical protein
MFHQGLQLFVDSFEPGLKIVGCSVDKVFVIFKTL